MASGLRVAQRNELDAMLRLVSIRSSPPKRKHCVHSTVFFTEYERKRSLPPGCRRSTDLTVYLIKENLLNYHDLIT